MLARISESLRAPALLSSFWVRSVFGRYLAWRDMYYWTINVTDFQCKNKVKYTLNVIDLWLFMNTSMNLTKDLIRNKGVHYHILFMTLEISFILLDAPTWPTICLWLVLLTPVADNANHVLFFPILLSLWVADWLSGRW